MTDLKIIDFCEKEGLLYNPIIYYNDENDEKQPNKRCIFENNSYSIDKLNEIKLDRQNIQNSIKSKIQNKQLSKLVKGKTVNEKSKKLSSNELKSIKECYSIYLKHHPEYYVIDIDEHSINSINDFIVEYESKIDTNIIDIFKKLPWTRGNNKGIHIYIKLKNVPKYKNQQKVFNGFDGDLLKVNNCWETGWNEQSKIIYKGNYEPYEPIDFEIIKPIIDINKLNIQTNEPKKELIKNTKKIIDDFNNNEINNRYDITVFNELYDIYRKDEEKMNTIYFIEKCFEYDYFSYIDFSSYDEWIRLGFIIKEEFGKNGLKIFNEISKQIPKYEGFNNVEKHYNDCLNGTSTNPLSIGSLKHTIKCNSDPKQYYEIQDDLKFNSIVKTYNINENRIIKNKLDKLYKDLDDNQTECKIAEFFTILFGNVFKSTKKDDKGHILLKFTFTDKGIWDNYKNLYQSNTIKGYLYKNLNEIIKNKYCKEIYYLEQQIKDLESNNDITAEEKLISESKYKFELEKKTKAKNKIIDLLETKSRLDNIQATIIDNIYEPNLEDKLNSKQLYLPMKNGKKINGNNIKEITWLEKEDNFSFCCDAEYIDLNENMQEYKDVHEYFLSLMQGHKNLTQLLVDIIKTTLCGVKLKKIICFIGAHGSNGKSMLLELLKTIFKDFIGNISKNILFNGIEKNSGPQPDVITLKRQRLSYSSELSSEQKLHTDLKTLSGADPIQARDLWDKPETFMVPSNIFLISNEMPTIDVNDTALINRLVIFPFNNIFTNDQTYKNKIFASKDAIFSYILKYGNILYNVDENEDLMKDFKNEIIEDNTKFEPIDIFIKQYCQNIKFHPLKIENNEQYNTFHKTLLKNYTDNNYYKDQIYKDYDLPLEFPEENLFGLYVDYLINEKNFNIKDKETFTKNILSKYRKKLRGLGFIDRRSNNKYYYNNLICSYPLPTQQYLYEYENK